MYAIVLFYNLTSDNIYISFFSVTMNSIIQKNFLEEYAERKLEIENLTDFGVDVIPLFVMEVVIPCQKFPLHIFEPRYRLMVSWFDFKCTLTQSHICRYN